MRNFVATNLIMCIAVLPLSMARRFLGGEDVQAGLVPHAQRVAVTRSPAKILLHSLNANLFPSWDGTHRSSKAKRAEV